VLSAKGETWFVFWSSVDVQKVVMTAQRYYNPRSNRQPGISWCVPEGPNLRLWQWAQYFARDYLYLRKAKYLGNGFSYTRRVFLKMRALWNIVPCIVVTLDRCFSGSYCLYHQGDEWLWWWRQYAPLKRRSTPRLHGAISRRLSSSYSPPWEPEMSQGPLWVVHLLGESNAVTTQGQLTANSQTFT
jgi:hypothetical protein